MILNRKRRREKKKNIIKNAANERKKKAVGPEAFNPSGKSMRRRIDADRTKELIMLRGRQEAPKERNECEEDKRKRTGADFGTVPRGCRSERASNHFFFFY